MSGIISTSNHPKHLWPGVKAFFGQVYGDREEEWRGLVDVSSDDKAYVEMVAESGFGLAAVKSQGSSVSYDTTAQDFVARWTHIVYGLGYIVTREEIEDNQYESVSMDRAQSLKISMAETKENVIANLYNRAFTSGYNGGDGVCLLSASHPTRSGNQSNLLATAADLSEAALEDMLIQIMGATNSRGIRTNVRAEKLAVPRQLYFEANRIMKSVLQPDTANNAINAIKATGQLPGGIVMNRYLTDADAWFVRTNAPKGLTLFQRRALDFAKDNDFDTENAKAKATERYIAGWGDWRTLYGTPGA